MPVLGWIVAPFLKSSRCWKHYSDVLEPIEKQLVQQLTARPKQASQLSDSMHQQVVKLISDAVAYEKHIDPPAIHPCDPFQLLFWGAYDDWTPLVFALSFREQFGKGIADEEFAMFWNNDWLVSDVASYCVNKIRAA